MAVVIHQEPRKITAAWNDSWILAYSTQYAQPNFKYIVEVTIGFKTIRRDILPRLDGGVLFNCKEIVSSFIQRPFDFNSLSFVNFQSNVAQVDVVIKEYYGGVVQALASTTFTITDSCYDENFFRYDYNEDNTFTDDLANVFSADSIVTLDTDIWFKYFLYYGSPTYLVDSYTVEVNGIIIGTVPLTGDCNMVNIGAKAIAFLKGSPLAVGDNILIEFNSDEPNTIGVIGYNVSSICSKYENKRIYFYDRAGQIRYKNFDLVSSKNITKEVNSVRLNKDKVTVSAPFNKYGSNIWEREKNITSTQTKKEIVLNTNWITEKQSKSLTDLFDSPLIWIYENNKYIPLSIKDTAYSIKTKKVDKLFNYSITCEYDNLETRQRGI